MYALTAIKVNHSHYFNSKPFRVLVVVSLTSSARRLISTSRRGNSFPFSLISHILHRAGELSNAEIDKLITVIQHPRQFKIPNWMLNRQKDVRDGKFSHIFSNALDAKLRDDLERLKKIRVHKGLRHYWGLRVRGQHSKTTGRKGRTMGVSKKKGG